MYIIYEDYIIKVHQKVRMVGVNTSQVNRCIDQSIMLVNENNNTGNVHMPDDAETSCYGMDNYE